jgi:hypothetical protein
MAKRIPIDCKRIKESHLSGLSRDDLATIAERLETQTQALNRTRRLIAKAVDELTVED